MRIKLFICFISLKFVFCSWFVQVCEYQSVNLLLSKHWHKLNWFANFHHIIENMKLICRPFTRCCASAASNAWDGDSCYRCLRCLSVTWLISTSLCKNGWTDQDAVWGEHCPWNIVLDVGPDPPQRGEGGLLLDFRIPSYLKRLKLEAWNLACI